MPFGPLGLAEVKSVFPTAALSAVLCTSRKGVGNTLVFAAGTGVHLYLHAVSPAFPSYQWAEVGQDLGTGHSQGS